jgi:hypothetical protein
LFFSLPSFLTVCSVETSCHVKTRTPDPIDNHFHKNTALKLWRKQTFPPLKLMVPGSFHHMESWPAPVMRLDEGVSADLGTG